MRFFDEFNYFAEVTADKGEAFIIFNFVIDFVFVAKYN